MHFQEINISQFKNHEERHFVFSEFCNVVVGSNGSGKTSLLDALHFLCLTKSAFSSQDATCVLHGTTYFALKAKVQEQKQAIEIVCSYALNEKKALLIDKKSVEKFTEHIGRLPVVLMTPFDTDMIRDGAETRRKFLDNAIAQIEPKYLVSLMRHNKILLQRNAILKQFVEQNYVDQDLINTYNHSILPYCKEIYQFREAFIVEFLPHFQYYYGFLTDHNEAVSINYISDCAQANFEEIFLSKLKDDLTAQRTTTGTHKDDLVFEIKGFGLKKYGSQGQQKSFVLAMKLALYTLISAKKNKKPILLMDDIFDKLDEVRISKLLALIDSDNFGQVFITDARPERSKQLMEGQKKEVLVLEM